MSFLGHGIELARIDVVRMVRKHADWQSGLGGILTTVLSLLVIGAVSIGGGYLTYVLSAPIATGDGPFPGSAEIDIIGGIFAIFWLVITVFFLIRALGQRGTLTEPEGTLTVVPTGEAYLGVVLSEYAYYLLWALGPAIGVGVGLSARLGIPWPAVTIPIAVATAGIASVGIGYPAGVGFRHFVTRFPFVARHKGAIILVVFLAYFAIITTGALNEVVVSLFEPMQASPAAWFAHVALLGIPAFSASILFAAGALGVAAVIAVGSVIVGIRIAERHWFSDPVLAGEPEPETATETPDRGIEQYLEPVLGSRTAALVTLSWRRSSRTPLKLLYALYPVLFMAGIFADILQTGEVPAYLPYAMILFVAWGAGVVFTLNPLGDQGAGLSATLLSKVDGRTFVHAHLLASLIVAVPLGIATTAIVAFLAPIDTMTAALLVAIAPLVMIVSSVLSIGIGMAFPKFEATNVTRAMKTVLPSIVAFAIFSAHLFLTAVAGAVVYEPLVRELAAGLLSFILPFGISLTSTELYWIAAVMLVPLVLAPIPAYVYSIRRYNRYTIA